MPRLVAQVAMGVVFTALTLVGLAGNVLVCIAIYTNRKLRKKENLYFVSLAGADLLLSVLVMPFAAVNDVVDQWLFGSFCKVWISLDIMCCTCSILHLCAISFDRYYHIHDPMRYQERVSVRKVVVAICAVWALSILVAFTPLSFDTSFHLALSYETWTNSSHQCGFTLKPVYAVVSSMVSFYLPCCIMIAAYTKLYRYAQRHAQTIRHQLQAAKTLLSDRSPEQHGKKRESSGVSDHKARITLGAIMGIFISSWLPFFICNIVRSFCPQCVPDWLFITLTWMGYANSAQNPIIYSIFNRDFREAFGKILFCKKRLKSNSQNLIIVNGNAICRLSDLSYFSDNSVAV